MIIHRISSQKALRGMALVQPSDYILPRRSLGQLTASLVWAHTLEK